MYNCTYVSVLGIAPMVLYVAVLGLLAACGLSLAAAPRLCNYGMWA